MPTPPSQSENSEVMEMLRNMKIHQQKFSTLQEDRFMALQDQLQIQSDNFAYFTSLQEERYSGLRNQIKPTVTTLIHLPSQSCNGLMPPIALSQDPLIRLTGTSLNSPTSMKKTDLRVNLLVIEAEMTHHEEDNLR